MDTLNRRLNKIATLMDRHTIQKEMQDCYIEALSGNPSTDRIYKYALTEAVRLSTYHEKEFKKLEDEKNLLTANQPEERRLSLNTELLENEEKTVTETETQTQETEAKAEGNAPAGATGGEASGSTAESGQAAPPADTVDGEGSQQAPGQNLPGDSTASNEAAPAGWNTVGTDGEGSETD